MRSWSGRFYCTSIQPILAIIGLIRRGAVKTVSGHFQRYGLVGSSDIIGHTGQGRAVYIEIKTKSGKLSKDQVKFQSMVLKSNCIHIVAREDFMTDPQFSVMEIRNYGN
jgi:hypothetical protein